MENVGKITIGLWPCEIKFTYCINKMKNTCIYKTHNCRYHSLSLYNQAVGNQ
jgi:hypothetical protein